MGSTALGRQPIFCAPGTPEGSLRNASQFASRKRGSFAQSLPIPASSSSRVSAAAYWSGLSRKLSGLQSIDVPNSDPAARVTRASAVAHAASELAGVGSCHPVKPGCQGRRLACDEQYSYTLPDFALYVVNA